MTDLVKYAKSKGAAAETMVVRAKVAVQSVSTTQGADVVVNNWALAEGHLDFWQCLIPVLISAPDETLLFVARTLASPERDTGSGRGNDLIRCRNAGTREAAAEFLTMYEATKKDHR